MPGAFKLLLFRKISNFFNFMLGGQFLLPQRANNENGNQGNIGKGKSPDPTIGKRDFRAIMEP